MVTRRSFFAKTKLHGRYRTPRFRIGAKVNCEVRGELAIVGSLSTATFFVLFAMSLPTQLVIGLA